MRRKAGYTISEALICMLLISIIGLMSVRIAGAYSKTAYERDRQLTAYLQNLSMIERIKAEVKTLPQLYAFAQENPIRVILIGQGEVVLEETVDGIKIITVSAESFEFSDKLKSDQSRLFRIEAGGEDPNSSLMTVLRLEADGDD